MLMKMRFEISISVSYRCCDLMFFYIFILSWMMSPVIGTLLV